MDALEAIAAATLYEGYVLWPYRRSAQKNQQRWTFGGVYPRGFVEATRAGDAWRVQAECLVTGAQPLIDVEVELRFLQVVTRRVARGSADGALEFTDELGSGAQRILAWDEAVERRIVGPGECGGPAGEEREAVDGGVIVRAWAELCGSIALRVEPVTESVTRVTATLENTSRWSGVDRVEAQKRGFMSAHFVLRVRGGAFVSSMDPPAQLTAAVAECHNSGLWPVLVGDERTMLASPIILYDYPRIAPESPGPLFDSSEIDQLLMLNLLALSDAEKAEIRATDPRARDILDRAESLSADDFARLHGAIRAPRGPGSDVVKVNGVLVSPGTTVRLHPRGRADVFDLVLNGKLATVEAIEQDFDDRVYLAVTLADDPGRDLGMARMPGHRFFFSPEEVEPL